MKKTLYLIILFVFSILCLESQGLKLPPKLFTMRQSRVSFGLGFDAGHFGYLLTSTPNYIKKEKIITDSDTIDNAHALALGIDWYSPFSLIGFYGEVNINFMGQRYKTVDNMYNDYTIEYIELPIYIKLRTGGVQKSSHLLICGGVGYTIPVCVKYSNSALFEDKHDNRLSNELIYHGIIGIEVLPGSRLATGEVNDFTRAIFFGKFTYRNEPFNTAYPTQLLIPIDNNDLVFKDYFIQLGLRLFFKVSKG